MNSVEWSYYNKDEFKPFAEFGKWFEIKGEGNNAGMQAVTAVNKLVYKWYNDGDVYDNTYCLKGWWNDISSYANWLYEYADGCDKILERISKISTESGYTHILKDLADLVFDENYLNALVTKYNNETIDSIYSCDTGVFTYEECDEEDEEYEEEEEYEDEDEEDY